jgi:hypothetical protein
LQEPDTAGPVSDHRRADDPASDPTVDLADRADSGSSWRFLSWERAYNGSQVGFVPDKKMRLTMAQLSQPDVFRFALADLYFRVVGDCAASLESNSPANA